jgi:hypothetical protein
MALSVVVEAPKNSVDKEELETNSNQKRKKHNKNRRRPSNRGTHFHNSTSIASHADRSTIHPPLLSRIV